MTGNSDFPIEISSVVIESNNSRGMKGATLTFRDVEMSFLRKEKFQCKDSSEDSGKSFDNFIQCSKEKFWLTLPPTINCKILDMNMFIPHNSALAECSNDTVADAVYWAFGISVNSFVKQSSNFGCPVPCKQISYALNLNYFHKNTIVLPSFFAGKENSFFLSTSYSTFDVEERIENLEYDLENLLVSAGGNLGLFLGFSCMSLFFIIIDFVQRFFK